LLDTNLRDKDKEKLGISVTQVNKTTNIAFHITKIFNLTLFFFFFKYINIKNNFFYRIKNKQKKKKKNLFFNIKKIFNLIFFFFFFKYIYI